VINAALTKSTLAQSSLSHVACLLKISILWAVPVALDTYAARHAMSSASGMCGVLPGDMRTQVGETEEGLRAETKRLEVKLAKGDTMRAEQHARIVQLEAIVASVKVRRCLGAVRRCRIAGAARLFLPSSRRSPPDALRNART